MMYIFLIVKFKLSAKMDMGGKIFGVLSPLRSPVSLKTFTSTSVSSTISLTFFFFGSFSSLKNLVLSSTQV